MGRRRGLVPRNDGCADWGCTRLVPAAARGIAKSPLSNADGPREEMPIVGVLGG